MWKGINSNQATPNANLVYKLSLSPSGTLRAFRFNVQTGITYEAGSGIDITGSTVSVKVDDKTIVTNASGKLETTVGGWKEVIPAEPLLMSWIEPSSPLFFTAGSYTGQKLGDTQSIANAYADTGTTASGYRSTYTTETAGGTGKAVLDCVIGGVSKQITLNGNYWVQAGAQDRITCYAADTPADFPVTYPNATDNTRTMVTVFINGARISIALNNNGGATEFTVTDSFTISKISIYCNQSGGGGTFVYHPIDANFVPIDNSTIVNDNGVLKAVDQSTSYSAGSGIDITGSTISVKVDGTTIDVNSNGELEAIGGGGSSYTFTNGLSESGGTVTFDYNGLFGTVASNNRGKINGNYYGIELSGDNNSNKFCIETYAGGTPYGNGYGTARIGVGSFGTERAGLCINASYAGQSGPIIDFTPFATNFPAIRNNANIGTSTVPFHNGYFSGNVTANNIPAPPSADGEYDLHCSVSSGTVTYSWIART